MNYKSIPHDLNAEILLAYLGEARCKVRFRGHHKRNAYSDVVDIAESWDGEQADVTLCRNSIYNILPECMFHPLDRFSDLPEKDRKEKQNEQFARQEQEVEDAYRFFAPVDALLLRLRIDVRERLRRYSDTDSVLQDIICDRLDETQMNNSFIRQILPVMPYCKLIRGDKTLLAMMLRKVLVEEGLQVVLRGKENELTDERPRYDCLVGDGLEAFYMGNTYTERVTTYEIHYWADDRCDKDFLAFINELDVFRHFIKDWFLSVEEDLVFDVSNDIDTVRLSDNCYYNYLNYNTNL